MGDSRLSVGWRSAIKGWTNWYAAGGAPKTTIELRTYQLTRLAKHFSDQDPWALTTDELAAWLAEHQWSRETLRSYRAALRTFYGWAHASGFIEQDPARLLRRVPATIGVPRPAAEVVIADGLRRADQRAYLMLMLGSRHGLRRGEIARVSTRDLRVDDEGWSLLVHGKGDKERIVPLLADVARLIRDSRPGWVFPNGQGSHLTPAHVGVIVRRALDGVATAHQLRHRFATRTYQATKDIRAVQELLGHASVATTQRYTKVADNALRIAVQSAAS